MLFVFLHRALPSPRARAASLWGICFLILAWRCALVYGLGVSTDRTYLASDTRFDSILFGCALALLGNPALDPERPGERVLWLRVLLPAGVVLLLLSFVYRDPRFRETFRYTLQGLALYPVFICAVRNPTLGLFRLLNHPLARRIGVLSYGLYLVHHVVIYAGRRWLPIHPILQAGIAFGVSVALAEVMWRSIEQPAGRLRRRLSRSAPPARAELATGGPS
jgi:peptidoglycan/LPS O-acetylase OafA/YrhL